MDSRRNWTHRRLVKGGGSVLGAITMIFEAPAGR